MRSLDGAIYVQSVSLVDTGDDVADTARTWMESHVVNEPRSYGCLTIG